MQFWTKPLLNTPQLVQSSHIAGPMILAKSPQSPPPPRDDVNRKHHTPAHPVGGNVTASPRQESPSSLRYFGPNDHPAKLSASQSKTNRTGNSGLPNGSGKKIISFGAPPYGFARNNGMLTNHSVAGSSNMASPDSPRSGSIRASVHSANDNHHRFMTCVDDGRVSSSRHVSISCEGDMQHSASLGRNDLKNNQKDRRLHKALTTGCIAKDLKPGLLQQTCSLRRLPLSPSGSMSARTLSSRFPNMCLDGGGMLSRYTFRAPGGTSSRFTNVTSHMTSDGGGMSSARGAYTNSCTAYTEPYSDGDREARRASSLGTGENTRTTDREVDQAYVMRKNIQLHREVESLRAKIVHLMGKNEKLEQDMAHLKKNARESKMKHHDAYSLLNCSPTPRKRVLSHSEDMNNGTEECSGACPAPSPKKSTLSAKSVSLSPRRARPHVSVAKTDQRSEEKLKEAYEKLQQRCDAAEAEAQFWKGQSETMQTLLEKAKENQAKHAQDESELSLLKAERAMMKYKTERSQRFALEKNKQLQLKSMALAAAENQIAEGAIRGFDKIRSVEEHAEDADLAEDVNHSTDSNAGGTKNALSGTETQNSTARINPSDSNSHLVDNSGNLPRGRLIAAPILASPTLAWKPTLTMANSRVHASNSSLLKPSSSQVTIVRAPSSALFEAITPPKSALTLMNVGTSGMMPRSGLMWGADSKAPGTGNGGLQVGHQEEVAGRLSPREEFGLSTPSLPAYSLSGRMSAPSPMMPSMFSQASFLSPQSPFETQDKS